MECELLAQRSPITLKPLRELEAQLAGRPPTVNDMERLPYLEQVVKEVLRIYPLAASLSRNVSHPIPEQFSEPEVFRPERFDPQHGEKHLPIAYIPFGAGSRTYLSAPFAMMELKKEIILTNDEDFLINCLSTN